MKEFFNKELDSKLVKCGSRNWVIAQSLDIKLFSTKRHFKELKLEWSEGEYTLSLTYVDSNNLSSFTLSTWSAFYKDHGDRVIDALKRFSAYTIRYAM